MSVFACRGEDINSNPRRRSHSLAVSLRMCTWDSPYYTIGKGLVGHLRSG